MEFGLASAAGLKSTTAGLSPGRSARALSVGVFMLIAASAVGQTVSSTRYVLRRQGRDIGAEDVETRVAGAAVDMHVARSRHVVDYEAFTWMPIETESALDARWTFDADKVAAYRHVARFGKRSEEVDVVRSGDVARCAVGGARSEALIRPGSVVVIDGCAMSFAFASSNPEGPVQLLQSATGGSDYGILREAGVDRFRRLNSVVAARRKVFEFAHFSVDVWSTELGPVAVRDSRSGVFAVRSELSTWRLDEAPPAAIEEDVVIRSGDVGLAGTWTRPPGAGPVPALLLLAGSGPDDRDARINGRPFMDRIAWDLAEQGIASLRLDDRGIGGSEGDFRHTRLEQLTADARRAYRWLSSRGDVARCGILGHSEGALVATLVAAGDAKVAAVFSLASPALPLDVVLGEQGDEVARREGLGSEAPISQRRFYADVAESPSDVMMHEGRELQVGWLRDHFRNRPLEAALAVSCPIEIFQGDDDINVMPYHADLFAATAAFLGRGDIVVHRLPGLDHGFMRDRASTAADGPGAALDSGFRRLLRSRAGVRMF